MLRKIKHQHYKVNSSTVCSKINSTSGQIIHLPGLRPGIWSALNDLRPVLLMILSYFWGDVEPHEARILEKEFITKFKIMDVTLTTFFSKINMLFINIANSEL